MQPGILYRKLPPKAFTWTNKRLMLVLTCHHLKPARASVIINTHRAHIMQTLTKKEVRFPPNTLIQIALYPAGKIATSEQISQQIAQILANIENKNQIRNKYSPMQLNQQSIKKILFPFQLIIWNQISYSYKSIFHFKQLNTVSTSPKRCHWIFCHHYILFNTPEPSQFIEDLLGLRKVLKKFDFIQFLSDRRMRQNSIPKYKALVAKLFRIFKWKSIHTEKYLRYLVQSFECGQVTQILEDFKIIADNYQNSSLQTRHRS